jgi:hypothetical protein
MTTSDTSRDGDRAILELAAKAAGIEWIEKGDYWKHPDGSKRAWWNPLTDDGDALRLAVKLELTVVAGIARDGEGRLSVGGNMEDPYAATRRAIVRCAASIASSARSETKGVA